MDAGDPIRGSLRSVDATAGVAIKLYRPGTATERAIASDEFLEVESVHVAAAGTGQEVHVFVGLDSTPPVLPDESETVLRGLTQANGRLYAKYTPEAMAMVRGGKPFLITTIAGLVFVQMTGRVRKM